MKFGPIQTHANRYQPDPNDRLRAIPEFAVNQRFLALLVGLTALGLPWIMIISWWIGKVPFLSFLPVHGMCFYDSISHFYYSEFLGGVLVSALAFIGAFLLVYQGQTPEESRLANWTGWAPFAIALFPTTGRGCEKPTFPGRIFADLNIPSATDPVTVTAAEKVGQFFSQFWGAGGIHYFSALVLFVFLFVFSFYVFTRVVRGSLTTPRKRTRNIIYRWSGCIILACIILMALNFINWFVVWLELSWWRRWNWWNYWNITFWCEAFALWAFGTTWMTKGRWFFGVRVS